MKSLIVEDEFSTRLIMQKLLAPLGEAHVATDGEEAVEAVRLALLENAPYDLICLDMLMPGIQGDEVLRSIRRMEEENGAIVGDDTKVLMITSVKDAKTIMQCFNEQCDGYLVKPVDRQNLMSELTKLGFGEVT
jgi:two-component system, chemotaxis family, chemotaxis protein CheY